MDTHTQSNLTTLPLNTLRLSGANTRTVSPASIEAMAASIRVQGLIQNLVVTKGENGVGAVIAGGRRLRAMALLVEQGRLPPDWPVPCLVIAADDATACSLAENVQREAMHPADEYAAFERLRGENWTIDRIADAFGVTPLVVQRRLRLAAAAPALIELYRADEISTDQLIALCATDDHALQESTWKNADDWGRAPAALRRRLLSGEVDVSRDPRIGFIGGLKVFSAAGGEVRRDLFSGDGHGGFIRDTALLDRLVTERLALYAKDVQAEGWAWVSVWPAIDHDAMNRLGRVEPTVVLTGEAKTAAENLATEDETLANELRDLYDAPDEYAEPQSERIDVIEARLQEIEDERERIEQANARFAPEAMAYAGAVVYLGSDGKHQIARGLVRAEDRAKIKKATDVDVRGGRETKAAGRTEGALSEALRCSLWGHRNVAAQSVLADHANVAKILMALWSVETIRHGGSALVDLAIPHTGSIRARLHSLGKDVAARAEAFEARCVAAVAQLPEEPEALWGLLAAMTDAELDALVAISVARSLSLAPGHTGITAKVLDAMRFDMSDHFVPTAENYLGRVAKPLILEALTDAGQPADDALKAAKKGALVETAAQRLANSRWVPALIRSPTHPAADVAKATPKAAKKAAAPKKKTGTGAKTTAAKPTASKRKG